MRIWRDLFILLSIFAILWFVFAYSNKGESTWSDTKLISVANEEKLGNLIYDYQLKNEQLGKIIEDKNINKTVDTILTRLQNGLDTKYNYRVSIIKNDDVNAFTIPGGRIFIFTGLLEKLDSSAYLAAVLAHEIGHNQKQHLVRRLITTFGMQLLLGGDQVVVGEVLKELGGLKYARSQETEADEFAYKLLEKNNLHPNNFAKVMSEFIKLEDANFANLEILNTHPGSNDRRRNALEYKVDSAFKAISINVNWKVFQQKLTNVSLKENDSEK